MKSNTNTFVLTEDQVFVILPLFRAVKTMLTIFHGRTMQIIQNSLCTFRYLVQFTPCPPIHGGIGSMIPRIRLQKVSILITTTMRAIMDGGINIPQQVKVMDMAVSMVLTMFLVLLIHFQHCRYNKLQQIFLWICFLQ